MKQTHIPYGFVTGIIMVVISVAIYVAGVAFKPGMQYVSSIPFLIGLIMNASAFSKANDGYVTFGNVFASCFKATCIITIVSLAWAIISIFVFPDMKDKAMEMTREQMAKNPGVTEEQINTALTMMGKFWNTFMIAGVVFFSILEGAILSLIAAAIAKKKKGGSPIPTA